MLWKVTRPVLPTEYPVEGVFFVGKCRNHGCEVVLPVQVSVAPICPGAVGGVGCPGAVAGIGCPGAVAGIGGCPLPTPAPVQQCWTPLAACSQGVCIENGELLIAAVLLFLGLGFFRDGNGGGIGQILGAVKALQ